MTKLLEWLTGLVLVAAVWLALLSGPEHFAFQ
jgi:hypothetical protein